MTNTRSNPGIDYQLVAFDTTVDYDEHRAAGRTQNHIYDRSYQHLWRLPTGSAGLTISNTSSTWTEVARTYMRVPEDTSTIYVAMWGTHTPVAADACKVRLVRKPDTTATVIGTLTLPNGTGTLPLGGAISCGSGNEKYAIQVWSDSANDGTLDALVILAQ